MQSYEEQESEPKGSAYQAIPMYDQSSHTTTRRAFATATPEAGSHVVPLNYKFHGTLRQQDPTLIYIPCDIFEGPAQECFELFLQDLCKEYPDMGALNPRQLEFWVPKEPLPMNVTVTEDWKQTMITERNFRKILRPLSLSDQISVDNENLVHLIITGGGQKPVIANSDHDTRVGLIIMFSIMAFFLIFMWMLIQGGLLTPS
ncbi:hypothetical protein D9613_000192 [Agrocybe pediades]|uniref:Uncharacterized protein n=1 Tax=Agrocybe pediades TaxID=84607 RepID=A0A8H4R448_9AGAR|nr:hypothetical protein D9613_000192 [Agrocybe pediades]